MSRNIFFKKTLVFIIIFLFFCVSIAPCISVVSENVEKNDVADPQNEKTVSCYVFDRMGSSESEVVLSPDDFNQFYSVFEELNHCIAYHPFSDETRDLKVEFTDLLEGLGLIPEDSSRDDVFRLINPVFNGRKSLFSFPSVGLSGGRGSAFFCNFATFGEGSQFPVIILPRLIPILLFPIPRVIMHWKAVEGITSCGGLLSGRGFIAEGAQRGTALGFWGIGFSVFLPPVMSFGFIGYALYATATADMIYPWPPNSPPVISCENPFNGAINLPLDLGELSFRIEDVDSDLMNYQVTTNPNIGSGSKNGVNNGFYTIPINGLNSNTEYSWSVVVSDGEDVSEKTFSFHTAIEAPFVSDPIPVDGDNWVSIDLSELSFKLQDLQGDLMDFTVETVPDIGSGNGNGVDDGVYSVSIDGLDYSTDYTWFVNTTDGEFWTRRIFVFKTQPMMVFDPFEEGWQFRKQVDVNHTMVAGDLVNFPVLISTVDSDLREKAQDDGDDILFMDGAGVANRLLHEIESFDGSSGQLVAWVNVSSLSSLTDTVLWMYYGNPNCSSQHYPEKVWDLNYKSVHHFEETNVGEKAIKDSTQYNVDFTTANMEMSDFVTGKIDKSVELDGNNEHMGLTHDSPEDYVVYSKCHTDCTSSWTMSAWIKIDTNSQESAIAGRFDDFYWNDYGTGFKFVNGNLVLMSEFNNYNPTISTELSDTSNWHYIVGVTHSSTGKIYLDGVLKQTGDLDSGYSYRFIIGAQNYDGGLNHCFDGKIDEFRTSDIERNENWILTEFNNQNDPLSFLSFGPEESSP